MSSNEQWINNPIGLIDTNQNGKVIMNWSQANTLYNAVVNPPLASVISGSNFNSCVSRFMWFPFKFKNAGDSNYQTNLGGVTYKTVLNSGFMSSDDEKGYYLGEYKVSEFTSFKDFEPYSKYKLWLPFYGYVDLKSSDISNKYLEFLLYIDFNTGQSQYVIGVSNTHLEITNAPYLLYNANVVKDIRIIGTYTLDLGYEIPLGSVGMADAIRNISLSTIRLGGNLVQGIAKSNTNARMFNDYSSAVNFSNSAKETVLKEGFNGSLSVLESFQLHPQMDKVNNGILNNATPRSIIFVKYQSLVTQDITNVNFRKLYGLPTNKIINLNEVYGYTEVDELYLEDEAFGNATSEEKALLRNLFKGGVIFPDKILKINANLVNCTGSELNATSIKYEEGIVTLIYTPDTGYEFGSAPLVSLTGCEILNQVISTDKYSITIYNASESVDLQVNAIEIPTETEEEETE